MKLLREWKLVSFSEKIYIDGSLKCVVNEKVKVRSLFREVVFLFKEKILKDVLGFLKKCKKNVFIYLIGLIIGEYNR